VIRSLLQMDVTLVIVLEATLFVQKWHVKLPVIAIMIVILEVFVKRNHVKTIIWVFVQHVIEI
jgi:hypothetical protein